MFIDLDMHMRTSVYVSISVLKKFELALPSRKYSYMAINLWV